MVETEAALNPRQRMIAMLMALGIDDDDNGPVLATGITIGIRIALGMPVGAAWWLVEYDGQRAAEGRMPVDGAVYMDAARLLWPGGGIV